MEMGRRHYCGDLVTQSTPADELTTDRKRIDQWLKEVQLRDRRVLALKLKRTRLADTLGYCVSFFTRGCGYPYLMMALKSPNRILGEGSCYNIFSSPV